MKALLAGLLLGAVALQGQAQSSAIDHLEPPFWWVGMQHHGLQLMVHGRGLAALTPRLHYAGVTLRGVERGSSPNYLFIDLDIGPQARPGAFVIDFLRGASVVAHCDYQLRARAPGSAQRQGFGPRDAIYLVVPDRFANGDPGNDNIAGLGDPAERSNPDGRHGGDLQGLAEHLDYIASMGFTQIWSTPLLEDSQPKYSYHGYAASDLYRIDPRFGSNEDYRRFVAAARARGIGVIQDIVPNHIGSTHWWMSDLPDDDWVHHANARGTGPFVQTDHRHTTQQDAYASASDLARFTDGWFSPTMPDLNQRNPRLATYLIQNAIWWIEYAGLSGLRVDTYPYSDKAFLSHWSKAILDEYPHFSMVGEEMSGNPLVVSYWLRGAHNRDGYPSFMPSMMDFPLFGVLRQALTEPEGQGTDEGLGKLYEAMVNDRLYPDPSRMVLFDGNHDTSRIFSALGSDAALTRMAMAFIATTVRTPQWMYGTEILMPSPLERKDGVVRADFPGGWAGDKVNAFTGEGLSAEQRQTQDYLRRLLNWRKSAEAIHSGRLMHYAPRDGCYVYFRYTDKAKVMVVLNKNTTPTALELSRFNEMLKPGASGVDVISGERYALDGSLTVPARAALILEVHE